MSAEFEKTVLKELRTINKKLDRHEERLNSHDKKFDAIDKRFDAVDKKIDAVNQKVDTQFDLIGAKFDEVDGKLDKITSVLESLCHSVALIEEKMTFDIPALFDGYSMQHKVLESQRKELYPLINKVDNHDIRISILEQKTSE